jgi:hypothetical protein
MLWHGRQMYLRLAEEVRAGEWPNEVAISSR